MRQQGSLCEVPELLGLPRLLLAVFGIGDLLAFPSTVPSGSVAKVRCSVPGLH